MLLDHLIFTALGNFTGALSAANFSDSGAPTNTNHFFIYNSATGDLSYDADGTGTTAAVQFASVTNNLVLTSADFTVI